MATLLRPHVAGRPQSNRTGIRLESHKFEWAREGGGIAGGHPSNILDNSYPVGAVNINGDLPVILGPDGPTAGGFVVAATVVHAGLWKIGQCGPVGDTVRFREVTIEEARDRPRARPAPDEVSPGRLIRRAQLRRQNGHAGRPRRAPRACASSASSGPAGS